MKLLTILALLVCVISITITADERSQPTFTDEASIISISRADQSDALKTGALKKPFTLPQAIEALTTYRKIPREEYLKYAHQLGVRGSVTLNDGVTYAWEIEPDYAGTVKGEHGEIIYLLKPIPTTQPSSR